MIGLYVKDAEGRRRPLKEVAAEGHISGTLFALRKVPADRPRLYEYEAVLFGYPARLTSPFVTDADRARYSSDHSETGPADAECRQNQQQHRQKPACGPRTHLGTVWHTDCTSTDATITGRFFEKKLKQLA